MNSADRSFLCSLPPFNIRRTVRAVSSICRFLPLLSLPHQVQKKNSFSILLLRSAPTDATRCDPNPTRVAASFFSPAGMVQRERGWHRWQVLPSSHPTSPPPSTKTSSRAAMSLFAHTPIPPPSHESGCPTRYSSDHRNYSSFTLPLAWIFIHQR